LHLSAQRRIFEEFTAEDTAAASMPRPTVELSMIVRNEARTLDRCLASAAPLVDRIVVGDTGSTDDTLSIARLYHAETFSLDWNDHFALARNRLLQHARCDWVLVLDADEMLDRDAAATLPSLLADTRVHAYTLQRWDYLREAPGDLSLLQAQANPGLLPEARTWPAFVRSFHTRLFRRHAGIFFEHCVHEHVNGRVDALELTRLSVIGGPVIHHFGYVEEPEAADGKGLAAREKIEHYYRLGLARLTASPDDFDAHFQLGIAELQHLNEPEKALSRFRRAAGLQPLDGRAPLYGGLSLLRLNRLSEARQALLLAQTLGEKSSLLSGALGDIYLRTGQYARALAAYEQAHALGSTTALLAAKLGTAEVHLGHAARGLARIREAIAREPDAPALRALLALSERAAQSAAAS
jgi:tetratricopeptide (TPR) repeat protein